MVTKLYCIAILIFITIRLFHCSSEIKKDPVVEKSPGDPPAWTTGQKREDSLTTEYYVGYGQAKSKPDARKKSLNDVIYQISHRIITEVYPAKPSSTQYKNATHQAATISNQIILYDLKINQEYFEKRQSNDGSIYYEYYIYTAYPKKSIDLTRNKINNYFINLGQKALLHYEAAMKYLQQENISGVIHQLVQAKKILMTISFHEFPIQSLTNSKITNNILLEGYVSKELTHLSTQLFIKKINDNQSGTVNKGLPLPLIVQAYYKSENSLIPVSGAAIKFISNSKLLLEKKTNEKGIVKYHCTHQLEKDGVHEIKVEAVFLVDDVVIPFQQGRVSFKYWLGGVQDIGIVILEEEITGKGNSIIPKKNLIPKSLLNLVKESKYTTKSYHITTSQEREIFLTAFNKKSNGFEYFQKLTGGESILLCNVKYRYSSRFGKLYFYRTTMSIDLYSKKFQLIYKDEVKEIKGGGGSKVSAILSSIREANNILLPKLKARLAHRME